MRHYRTLTWEDRLRIEAWAKVNTSPRIMAEELGVHFTTIYKELKRGQYVHLNSDYTTEVRYSPEKSEEKKQAFLRAKGPSLKIGNDHALANFIEYKISVEHYSPEGVLGEIKRKGLHFDTTLTKQTIYRYIDEGIFLTLTNKDLPVKKNKDVKHPRHIRAARPPKGTSIDERPEEIETRETFGHWEMDSVEGKKGTKKTLLVLTERKTRKEVIRLMKDKTAASVVQELDRIEAEMGTEMFNRIFRTITVDNGSEFSDYKNIERNFNKYGERTKVYFCHPYCASERGSNENQNRFIRRYFPKGYDFTNTTKSEIRKVEKWLNEYPRKMFDYYSSQDLYEMCLREESVG